MDGSWSSDWSRVTLPIAVLALLESTPTHGYLLVARLSSVGHVGVTGGTLYPLLARLSDKGWIEHEWEATPAGPTRKTFAITDDGRRALTEMLDQWSRVRTTLDAIKSMTKREES